MNTGDFNERPPTAALTAEQRETRKAWLADSYERERQLEGILEDQLEGWDERHETGLNDARMRHGHR